MFKFSSSKSCLCPYQSFYDPDKSAPPPSNTPPFRVKMEARDFTPLKGRRIVIDPGHGGRFSGAVGMQGLREADINLAVGLHLWGLLKQAGAEAIMTRSADVDLCPPGSTALREIQKHAPS